jgi:prepilin-type processing-associated H-X9-DG protein
MGVGRDENRIDLEQTACGDIYTDGIFFPDSQTRISEVLDGTSHTLAVGERNYIFRDWMTGATQKGLPNPRVCTGSESNIRYPINAEKNHFGYYVGDADAPNINVRTMLLNDLFFGSYHDGSAQFCFADGSVRIISETIDFAVFGDMSTIAGGEIFGLVH